MRIRNTWDNQDGIALVITMFAVIVIAAVVTGAVMVGGTHQIISRQYERESQLELAADAGLELARAMINGDKTLYPDTGYVALLTNAPVKDASGSEIPGLTQSLYVGPSGVTTGQYGVFGSAVSVVEDAGGGIAIRRGLITQESFAKYAYFTDYEPSNISFGGGDAIFGPVHTNDYLKIYASGASFHSETKTAKTVQGAQYGTFYQGYEEYVPVIPMPETADLEKLRIQGQIGNASFTSSTSGGMGEATMRIEFVSIDLEGDGEPEGFFKVFSSPAAWYVAAQNPYTDMLTSRNCGGMYNGEFQQTKNIGSSSTSQTVIKSSSRRCYPGGADELQPGDSFQANDAYSGSWLQWPGPVSPLLAGRDDAEYLFPITRELNPSFRGVIFVDGKVALSGRLRGRVTVAATNDIILIDDITYNTDPGSGSCQDILGIFSGDDIVVSDNTINAPQRPYSGQSYRTYDDTMGEFFHGVVLALDIFTVENYGSGPSSSEPCEGTSWGRGCLYLTGGIIQRTRGAVGTTGGTGYLKRYAYDTCGATDPPPYFPTTGHFIRSHYYPVDPVGFSIQDYFDSLTPNG